MQQYNRINIYELILNLEKKHELFSLNEHGVYFWKLIRLDIIRKLQGESLNKKRENKKIGKLIKNSVTSIIRNPYFISGTTEYLVFENPRKILLDQIKIDPYTHFLIPTLENVYILDDVYNNNIEKSLYAPSSSVFLLKLVHKIRRKIKRVKPISVDNLSIISELENIIFNETNVKLNLVKQVQQKINGFLVGVEVYSPLFKSKNLKEIFLVCSYGKEHIIHAAQMNNIKVTEIQHGVMSDLHFGYSFPKNTTIPYFPDRINFFGNYWIKNTNLPQNLETEITGYDYLNYQVEKLNSYFEEKKQKSVLVVSQPTIAIKLFDEIYELAQSLSDYNFFIKLHPQEFEYWDWKYPRLVELSKFKNVTIFKDEKTIHELLARSYWVIGVYSTSLLEAIAFKANPIVIGIQGHEHISNFVKTFSIPVFYTNKEISFFLEQNNNTNKYDLDLYSENDIWENNKLH
ncbi:hypothetical protein [Exiguobacterium sp. s6]|uniref:hypothetical protein n=1 Tax=Exiguobacterium sp. s6 TaxID=2751236 RepID=UPI001BEC3CA7|nr:hypothetical protein [Exiguobacterium sp. s6]